MLCNITQNAIGQLGGYLARSNRGDTLPGPARGGTLPGGVPWWGVPWWGGTLVGGTLQGGTLLGGYLVRVPPPARSGRGGTQLGQHREYLSWPGVTPVLAGGVSQERGTLWSGLRSLPSARTGVPPLVRSGGYN